MKKLILILAIALIASPVFALSVALTREGTTNVIDLTYSDACSTNLPRAFALDLTFTTGAQFTGVVGGSYMVGESNRPNHKGYGIYPARISIDSTGVVQNWGTPLADSNDPGASGTILPSGHMVLEFASLYYDDGIHDTNAPPTSGTLCKFTVNPGAVSNPVITMSDELTYRGGIVLEQGQQDLTAADKTLTYTTATAPGKATNPSPASAATPGINVVGTTLTWTSDSGATSQNVYFGTVASPVTLVGTGTSYVPTLVQGVTYYWRVDEINGAGTTTGDIWTFNTDCMKTTGQGYANWIAAGKPSCWCYMWQRLGDIDGKDQGSGVTLKRIGSVDLTAFGLAFNKKRSQFTGNMICADLDHLDQGSGVTLKACGSVDLAIFGTYFNKKSTQLPNPPSYAADYYYYIVP